MTASTNNEAGLRFLLIAGKPIEEPVVQYGPFVMNTQVCTDTCTDRHQLTDTGHQYSAMWSRAAITAAGFSDRVAMQCHLAQ